MELEEGENPFKLPPDDKIFLIRAQERDRRKEERERVSQLSVAEKTTASSRVRRNRRIDDSGDEALPVPEATATRAASASRGKRREKENVSLFVSKKRDMFLVQMSLDIKNAEILKLHKKAKQKDEALKKTQQMLEDDVSRFDAFLHSNDQAAHRAIKNADEMSKQKQDKIHRIRQIRSQLSAIQSEITKLKEQRDECLKYKAFLVRLTPQEWKSQKEEEKRDRQRQRKQSWVDRRMTEINEQMQAEIEAEEKALEEKQPTGARSRRPRRQEAEQEAKERELSEARRRRIKRKYPMREQVEDEFQDSLEAVSSGEEMPLYFEEHKQLLEVFSTLEENNLFLIQTGQDTEEALEELQKKFEDLKRTRGAHAAREKAKIENLNREIASERAKCEELENGVSQKNGSSMQEELLREMKEKVREVHSTCGYVADKDPDTLLMLRDIEAKMEEYLAALDEAEESGLAAHVQDLERQAFQLRREKRRKERNEQQNQRNEQIFQRNLQRSKAPIEKKVGKQIMFRSHPQIQARRVVQEDDGFDEAMKEHNVFGIWLTKDGIPKAEQPVRPM